MAMISQLCPHGQRLPMLQQQRRCRTRLGAAAATGAPAAASTATDLGELEIGAKLRGEVVSTFEGKTGPKAWVRVAVTRPGRGGAPVPVRAMLRLRTKQEKERARRGAVVTCYAIKVQVANGRLEASLQRPKERSTSIADLPEPTVELSSLQTGQRLEGIVVGMLPQAAFVSCGVGRELPLKNGGTRVKPLNGYLRQADLVDGVALETQLVKQAGTRRILRIGDAVEVWVRKAWPSEGRFCVTLDPDVSVQSVQQEAREALKTKRRYQRTRASTAQLQPGKERTASVVRIVPFGLMLDIGARKPALLHVTQIAQATGTKVSLANGSSDFAAPGDMLHVSIISNNDGRIELGFVGKVQDSAAALAGDQQPQPTPAAAAAAASAVAPAAAQQQPAEQSPQEEYDEGEDSDYESDYDSDDDAFDPNDLDLSRFDDF